MNKIISANINGFVFQIDEAAYDILKTYLETIRQKVNSEEVFTDIENRIAELFDYKLKNGNQAIFREDVQDIIAQIGNPEQFGAEEAAENEQKTQAQPEPESQRRRGYRRLYRNPDDKVLGGVCSGIGAYFDIDPLIPRLAFAACFFFMGTGFLLYILLMIVLPKARTPAEKLEMRGEPVDYKNLSKSVENDFKDAYERYKPRVKSGFDRALDIIVRIGMIMLIIILVSIFVPGCFGVLTSIGIASWSLPVLNSYMFTSYTESIIILIGLILFLVIPLIGIGYKLVRIIFKTKPMPRYMTMTLVALAVAGFGLLAYSTFNIGRQFSSSYKIESRDTLSSDSNKVLIIKANMGVKHTEFIVTDDDGDEHVRINSKEDMKTFLDEKINENIDLEVVKGVGPKPVITVTRRSAGSNRREAAANASMITYSYDYKDSVLYLNDYFSLGNQQLWRNQKVQITIEVPEGYKLYIDRSCRDILDYSEFVRKGYYRHDNDDEGVTGRYLTIDRDGIRVPVD